ncbi:MAG: C25 family cysteine peptidase, partial [Candidatus Zixiibacteriota bacterium]
VLDLQISGIWSEEVSTKGGIFNRISIPDCGVTNVVGEPNLPVIRKMVQIPYGAEVSVEVIWSKYVKKSLQELGIANRIIPVQPPIPKIEGAAEAAEFVIHEDVYQANAFYQQELAKVGDVGIIRGHRFVTVEISPVSYNPVSGTVRLYSQVQVRVNLTGSDMARTQGMLYRYASPPFEEICREMLINYSAYQDLTKGAPTLPIGYLIIVHEDYQSQAAPLAEWKRKKGFHVTLNVIGDGTSTTTIKNYIQDAYDNWPIPPTYVLFFGDVGWIPTYTGTNSGTATDLYYVQMDGDIFADILRARFPVRNTTEATDMVTKLLYYENPTSPDLEWMRHELFIASSDHASLVEATHGWAIVNYLIPMGIFVDSLWERLGGVTSTAVTNSINAGKAIVCYSGHGASSGWQTGSYDQTDVRNLNNADEYPLVLSHACSTNPFDMTECYGETWVKVANKGGIAFWGASNSSYWDEDDILERRMWDAAFAETCYTVAAMTDKALWHLYQHYGNTSSVRYYFDMYNVNGDPSVDIWTYIAEDLVVTFPGTIPMLPSHAVEINVATQDKGPLYGALVCLRKGAEVFETGYTDASGNLTLYVSPASLGNMELTVTAHNQLPFESYISVIPAGDAYLVFESQSVDDDSLGESLGDGDGEVDFAETVEFLVELKNFGDSAAHNTYGIISTTNPYITMVNDSAFWGEVPAGGTATCVNAFVFSVDPNVPDMEMITFQLDIQATNGSWSYDDITVVAHAPILVYKSKITEDLGGNDNGKPDPGESVDLTITLQNDGSAGVIQVAADLVCVDPYVTIDVSSATYPDMSSGGTGTSLSAYRFTADEECPDGYKVSMTLQISGCGGYYTEEIFEIRIGQRPILFVDDDGGDSHESYIMVALDSVGVLYDVWTHETDGCPPDTIFEQYQSVVWSTGDDYGSLSDPATLDATDEARLMTYLDNGGSLLLSSQDLLLDHNPDVFITDYLHVAGHNDDEGVTSVSGVSDDTISDGMSFGLSYPFYNFSDHIFPGAEAAGIFYETSKESAPPRPGVQIDEYAGEGAGPVNYCALRYPASGPSVYKVAFFTFAIEAVPESGTYPNNRYTLMRRIMNWFGIGRTASEVMHGDANGDEIIDVGDVVFLVNYLYKGDVPPAPWEAGDASCDGEVDLGDVVYLINYLYKGGDPPPC